jgi:hypothetical protein
MAHIRRERTRRKQEERFAVLRDVESIRLWMIGQRDKLATFYGEMYCAGDEQILDFLRSHHHGVYSIERFKRVKLTIIRECLFEWFEKYHLRPFVERADSPRYMTLLRKQLDERRKSGLSCGSESFRLGYGVEQAKPQHKKPWRWKP